MLLNITVSYLNNIIFLLPVPASSDPMYPAYLTPMDQLTMSKQPTMMQQLMADRRRRYQEHQMKILTKGICYTFNIFTFIGVTIVFFIFFWGVGGKQLIL